MNEASEADLPQRLYLIQDDVYHYRAGHLSNGNQVLMDEVHRVEFDTEGNMLSAFCQETSQVTVKAVDRDGNVLAAFSQEPRQSASMLLPFTPGTISVKPFFCRNFGSESKTYRIIIKSFLTTQKTQTRMNAFTTRKKLMPGANAVISCFSGMKITISMKMANWSLRKSVTYHALDH